MGFGLMLMLLIVIPMTLASNIRNQVSLAAREAMYVLKRRKAEHELQEERNEKTGMQRASRHPGCYIVIQRRGARMLII